MKMVLIYIEWADAIHNSEWFSETNAREWGENSDWIVRQVGWIVKETKQYILLAARMQKSVYDGEIQKIEYGGLQKIPKTWIIKRKVLKI